MNNSFLNQDSLFDKDSVVDSDNSEVSESSSEIVLDNEPKFFLSSLSTKKLSSLSNPTETEPQEQSNKDSVVTSEEKVLSSQELLQEVAMNMSSRRVLSISPKEELGSNSSLVESLGLDFPHPEGKSNIIPDSEEKHEEVVSATGEMADNGESTDTLDVARSYINIHASVRAFNGYKQRKKQQTDEARMQNHMLMNIFINRREQNEHRFPRNVFITSKYTVWNFLFINLFEQFSRIANFVFLLVTLVQLIPGVSPFNIWSTLLPLVFILLVTALKEAYEDYKRHKTDTITNSVPYQRVLRDGTRSPTRLSVGTVCEVPSCELVAGDIVVLKDQESIPADIIVLACSDSDGTCYVDTSSLDGETK